MSSMQSDRLAVPGAGLAYDVRGSGPLLLLIAGGEGGAEGYKSLAGQMADGYTVVTYDRRGCGRSTLDDPAQEVRLETHSDDAHYLLAALATGPVYVFGSSAGALVGLDLVIRYPEQVRRLVAHEPPVEGLLPEFDRFQEDIFATYGQQGGAAALAKFVRQIGVTYDDLEPGAELPPRGTQDMAARGEALIAYTFRAVYGYRLDVAALAAVLAAAPDQVVLAGGSAGRTNPAYRSAAALAERLGTSLVEFPSHHAGYMSYPRAFAEKLRKVLAAT